MTTPQNGDPSVPFLERLDRLERRVDDLHSLVSSLEAVLRINKQGWRKRIFGSKLFYFQHHNPRKLDFPSRYAATPNPPDALTIGIVTTTLNQGRFLEETIKSVIGQDYPRLSYYVQDAGSTDGTLDLLHAYDGKLSWSSETDSGLGHGLNKGFSHLDTEIMAYLNGDDLLTPGCLAYVANFFRANPDVDLIYGHRINVDEDGREIGRWVLPPHDEEAIKWADFIPQETMFWRRRVWDAIGPFDETLRFAVDWDFILRAQRANFRFKRLPRFLGCFRVHSQQKTSKEASVGEAECKSLRKIHLGFDPFQQEINKALRGFVRRHILLHRLHKFLLLRY